MRRGSLWCLPLWSARSSLDLRGRAADPTRRSSIWVVAAPSWTNQPAWTSLRLQLALWKLAQCLWTPSRADQQHSWDPGSTPFLDCKAHTLSAHWSALRGQHLASSAQTSTRRDLWLLLQLRSCLSLLRPCTWNLYRPSLRSERPLRHFARFGCVSFWATKAMRPIKPTSKYAF